MKTAHYFASKKTKFVTFGIDGKIDATSVKIVVYDKKEARAVAAKHCAKPWNF